MTEFKMNPFLATIGEYEKFEGTKFFKATGTLENIKLFLEDESIVINKATIKYTSVLNFILPTLFDDSPSREDGFKYFENMNGNIKFDYLGSHEEFETVFSKHNLTCIYNALQT